MKQQFVISGMGMRASKNFYELRKEEEKFRVEEEEEEEEDENVIPMLCYGLILIVLTTLLAAILFIPCYKLVTGNYVDKDFVTKIVISVLVGEIFGILISILCVMLQGTFESVFCLCNKRISVSCSKVNRGSEGKLKDV